MGRWRVKPGWYAIALLLPGALALMATILNVLLGAESPSATELDAWPQLFATFAFVLLVPGVGGAWEEPGWRGFAVPRLQVRQSALVTSLIMGVLIAGWHLLLMITGQVAYSDIVLILASVVVFNWVFNNAAGSVHREFAARREGMIMSFSLVKWGGMSGVVAQLP
jgi:membrane protease YdiL (CAAX protease family)